MLIRSGLIRSHSGHFFHISSIIVSHLSQPRSKSPYQKLMSEDLVSMAVDIPELDQPGNRGLLRTRWFPLVMTEPSLFLVIMLIAASHHATMQQQHDNQDHQDRKLNILTLRCEAVHAINQALTTHREATPHNDALIGAIAKMASYEAMFGSRDAYTVHMRGLRQVVGLRGGLDCLEEVMGGLLRRIVVWIDRNSAFLNGSGLYFPGEGFGSAGQGDSVEVEPNPGHFLGAS